MFNDSAELNLKSFSGLPTFKAAIIPSLSKILLAENNVKHKMQIMKYKPPANKYLIMYDFDSKVRTYNIFPNRTQQEKLESLKREVNQLKFVMRQE